jgi:farnesyl diphosphate synthase
VSLDNHKDGWRERVDTALGLWLPGEDIEPRRLHGAIRYSVFNGGKRLRPILVYAAGHAVSADENILDMPACAVECIHAYSLIHDDLPPMDDDDLRRGKPTCHRQYDEATAILAGDALQAQAFHILSRGLKDKLSAEAILDIIDTLAMASGSRGMAGGQAMDLAAVGVAISEAELENMHIHKTGALIRASIKMGAMCAATINSGQLHKLDHYGKCIGLAFQIMDDVLDETGDTQTLGKTQGADRAKNKPTYPSVLGLEASRELANELCADAISSLDEFGSHAEALRDIARYIIERKY